MVCFGKVGSVSRSGWVCAGTTIVVICERRLASGIFGAGWNNLCDVNASHQRPEPTLCPPFPSFRHQTTQLAK